MKYHEVVGYVVDGALICVDCKRPGETLNGEELAPVFAGEACEQKSQDESGIGDCCDRCTMPLIED